MSAWDLEGCGTLRLLRLELITRATALGRRGGGPDLAPLLKLWLLHRFGRWLVRFSHWRDRRI